jgi:hypothetical protein
VVQQGVSDVPAAVHASELEAEPEELEVLAEDEERLDLVADGGAEGELAPPLPRLPAHHLVDRLDAAERDVPGAKQQVGPLRVGDVELEGEAEGGDEEAASVAGGPTPGSRGVGADAVRLADHPLVREQLRLGARCSLVLVPASFKLN